METGTYLWEDPAYLDHTDWVEAVAAVDLENMDGSSVPDLVRIAAAAGSDGQEVRKEVCSSHPFLVFHYNHVTLCM
jgi:hypothetical protein